MYLKPMATFAFAREIIKRKLSGKIEHVLAKNNPGGKHEEAKYCVDKRG